MSEYSWLEVLHREHYDELLCLARAMLRKRAADVDEAEDIVQQAFLLAAEKNISSHQAPLKWMMKTVSNRCMNQAAQEIRASQKRQRLIRQQLSGAQHPVYAAMMHHSGTDACETRLMLEQALTEDERMLMRRYCLERIPAASLTAENGLSPAALRVRIHRLRSKVKKEYYGV